MGLDIQDAQSPRSDGSGLIDTSCWENKSGLCAWSSFKGRFPSILSVAFSDLLSDISASTLKGRHDTCAARFLGRGACTSSSVEHSSLQSPGDGMLSFQGPDRCLIPIQRAHNSFVTECKHTESTVVTMLLLEKLWEVLGNFSDASRSGFAEDL